MGFSQGNKWGGKGAYRGARVPNGSLDSCWSGGALWDRSTHIGLGQPPNISRLTAAVSPLLPELLCPSENHPRAEQPLSTHHLALVAFAALLSGKPHLALPQREDGESPRPVRDGKKGVLAARESCHGWGATAKEIPAPGKPATTWEAVPRKPARTNSPLPPRESPLLGSHGGNLPHPRGSSALEHPPGEGTCPQSPSQASLCCQ